MKLALVTHQFAKGDGQGRVNYEVAWQALRRGHALTLIAEKVAPDLRAHPAVLWVPVSMRGFPTALTRDLVFASRSAAWLRRHRRDADAIGVNGSVTWEPGDVNAAHFVHSAWKRSPEHVARPAWEPAGMYQGLYTSLNAALERRAFAQARRVVAVSDRVRADLLDIGISPERLRVILNGVDLEEFRPGPADRAAFGLPGGVPLALFVGDLRTTRKNLDTVLRALTCAPGAHLAVVGDTKNSPFLEMTSRLGLSGRVHFLGFRRDVAALMQAVDVFVSTARYEPFSLVLLEAMACGLPVVTARSVGAAQLVNPACGVVLPDANDADALAAALSRLTADRPGLKEMGVAARAVAERHSWFAMGDAYLSLYQEVVR